jgi:hypothetical protein
MNELKQLVTGNLLYQEHYARWLFLYRSYIGGNEYKSGNYLTRYQLETDKEYQARIQATPLDNQCQSIISVYNSFLFRTEPDRNYGSIANLPELMEFINDADLDGRSFDSFMKETSIWSKVFGHCWIMVSKPNIDAITQADEIAAGVRPYVSVLTPLVVLDWQWDRAQNGKYELSLLRYVEDINGQVQTIKTWTREFIRTCVVDTQNEIMLEEAIEDNQLGLIPAVISYNNRSVVRGLGVSAINDIADCQRFIYNCLSEVDQSIRLDSHPSLVKTADTLAGVGAGAIIQMPENLPGELKPYVLDFAGANIDNIYKSIESTINAIEKMANTGSVRGTNSTSMSGVAMETEFQLLNSRLSEMADNIELTEEGIWRLFCMYQNQQYNVTVEYPSSFNLRDTGREINELATAAGVNSTDPRVIAGINAKVLDWLSLDTDELAAIADPALLDLDSVPEPGELPE